MRSGKSRLTRPGSSTLPKAMPASGHEASGQDRRHGAEPAQRRAGRHGGEGQQHGPFRPEAARQGGGGRREQAQAQDRHGGHQAGGGGRGAGAAHHLGQERRQAGEERPQVQGDQHQAEAEQPAPDPGRAPRRHAASASGAGAAAGDAGRWGCMRDAMASEVPRGAPAVNRPGAPAACHVTPRTTGPVAGHGGRLRTGRPHPRRGCGPGAWPRRARHPPRAAAGRSPTRPGGTGCRPRR